MQPSTGVHTRVRKFFRFAVLPFLSLIAAAVGLIFVLSEGIPGERHGRGQVSGPELPAAHIADRARTRAEASEALGATGSDSQILFGDLHVHTTYSADAFFFALPLIQGEGVHPPADACDFARFCAELDFWSINDHAEALTPWQWAETIDSIRECNAVAGDPDNADTVAFLGWEWTQSSPEGFTNPHWGHKNILLRDTAAGEIPVRPIGAGGNAIFDRIPISSAGWVLIRAGLTVGDFPDNLGPYLDFNHWAREVRNHDDCPDGVAVHDLPEDCRESADTPGELFAKLDEWGYPAIVIPHGTTWGIHAPPSADLGLQLKDGQHDPARQRLFEVYSGHGNSELWRDIRDTEIDAKGEVHCAAPKDGYEPCCWRAGEIIRSRCIETTSEVCEERVARTRAWYLELPGGLAKGVVAGTTPDDWRECGQLAGTFLPALEYRPKMSAQYGLAVRPEGADADDAGAFRYGFIASSDNHKARAGPGYKEIGRKAFADAYGLRDDWNDRLSPEPQAPTAEPIAPAVLRDGVPFGDPGSERNASYYYTAGLVAVHADGRDRKSIFNALEDRRTYGTSGPRILLHFDIDNSTDGRRGMGSAVEMDGTPHFTVRAVGDFTQLPGCSEATRERLTPERLQRLCLGECY
ncbi:MAG: DUF3604 domain-containing protein, partial [bacterium]